MKHFTSIADVENVPALIDEALSIKANPYQWSDLGRNKTLGLIFMNPSLRTRLSTQKAAINLGMNVMVMNADKDGWALEMNDGAVMNTTTIEHIRDAAAVMGQYCDVIGIRCFPSLKNRDEDYAEDLLQKFIRYSRVPVVSLESATRHPLQSFADMITIRESWKEAKKPKVVLTWAPHIKPLPQAVANSFAEWIGAADAEFVVTQPKGLELDPAFTQNARIMHNQEEALKDADFVYVKNWSSYRDYGQLHDNAAHWLLDEKKMALTNQARIMHCLPVRRNVELPDALLDGPNSLVLQQASNRLYAAQTILKRILEGGLN